MCLHYPTNTLSHRSYLGLVLQNGEAGIETGTPGLQGKLFIPYTIATSNGLGKQCRPRSSYLSLPFLECFNKNTLN